MPKKTSSKNTPGENDLDISPPPPPQNSLVLTDYLPPGFTIPLPTNPCLNFIDPDGTIKRPANSWICYRSESTRFMREFYTVDEKGNQKFLEQGLVSRLCADLWHSMTPEEKQPWAEYAAMLAAEHKRQYPHYVFAPKTKEQKEKEKLEGKPAKPSKRVPSKSNARAQAAPYPRPARVSRLSPPTPSAGPPNLPNAPAVYQPLPYIHPPSTDLSSNPYAALTTLPYKTFKPFSMSLPFPPTTASPSLEDYATSPCATAVPTPEPSTQVPQPSPNPQEVPQHTFDWEMNEFFMSLNRLDVPNFASDIMSGEPPLPMYGSGLLPVISLEAEPGMAVAIGNLPGQDVARTWLQMPAAPVNPAMAAFDLQAMPSLEQDWIHPLVSVESNEVWPGTGEWLWGMGGGPTAGFDGHGLQGLEERPQQQDITTNNIENWYPRPGTNDPADWNSGAGTQFQDNYSVAAEFINQDQFDNGDESAAYYTQDPTPSNTYVPPAGAAFSSNRRVGGTWQMRTCS